MNAIPSFEQLPLVSSARDSQAKQKLNNSPNRIFHSSISAWHARMQFKPIKAARSTRDFTKTPVRFHRHVYNRTHDGTALHHSDTERPTDRPVQKKARRSHTNAP
jgi:hypothetical protein